MSGSVSHLSHLVVWGIVEGGSLPRTVEAPDPGYFLREALPPLVPHQQEPIANAVPMQYDGSPGPAFDPSVR